MTKPFRPMPGAFITVDGIVFTVRETADPQVMEWDGGPRGGVVHHEVEYRNLPFSVRGRWYQRFIEAANASIAAARAEYDHARWIVALYEGKPTDRPRPLGDILTEEEE